MSEKETLIRCHSCDAEISTDAKFCPDCGERIASVGLIHCHSCNAEIEVGSRFCPNCGADLNKQASKTNILNDHSASTEEINIEKNANPKSHSVYSLLLRTNSPDIYHHL